VANLAEAAASAVGANALLARVGAYYHDIGKLKRPMYFKENQMSDNPHDRTDPRVSTAILTAHPHDGVEMAVKAHLPEEIQEIILQHHGIRRFCTSTTRPPGRAATWTWRTSATTARAPGAARRPS
jgi:putative nucleotidyltransferase with HDIG domain